MRLQVHTDVSENFAGLAWSWDMDYRDLPKHPLLLPCSNSSLYFSCWTTPCRQDGPQRPSLHYLKPRDLPPTALPLSQLVTFARLADPYLLSLLPNVSRRLKLLMQLPVRERGLAM